MAVAHLRRIDDVVVFGRFEIVELGINRLLFRRLRRHDVVIDARHLRHIRLIVKRRLVVALAFFGLH